MNAGDAVQLKSGGPTMTVARVETINGQQLAICDWFEKESPKRQSFPVTSLKPAKPQ